MIRFLPAVVSSFLFAHSSSASRGSSAFDACLRARIGSVLPALFPFAAPPRDDIGQIIAACVFPSRILMQTGAGSSRCSAFSPTARYAHQWPRADTEAGKQTSHGGDGLSGQSWARSAERGVSPRD